jgi:outer membrane protein, heavy metal efflux system
LSVRSEIVLKSATFQVSALLVITLASGCSVQRYRPAPINPATSASQLESRRISDPELREYLEKSLRHQISPWPVKRWDLTMLTLAAFYFSPALDAARDRVLDAEAAAVTAGARPNPSLSISPGVPSPYLFSLDFIVPIETAGKRSYRIASAASLTDAARLNLASTGWLVRGEVRAALLNALLASRQLDLFRSQETILAQQVHLLDQRVSAGEVPQPEANFARIQLQKNRMSIQTAEGQVATTRVALATAIGVPVEGLGDADFSWSGLDSPPSPDSLSAHEIQRDAVVNRLDVRRALAQYAAAEADLQLEIAKQYPDLNIGPGYSFEESSSFFKLGLSATLPVFNRNQGPIAEAEARRKEAGAAFLATQAQVISQSEQAFAGYRSAYKELTAANDSLHQLQQTQQETIERAVRAGEQDRLTLIGVELESAVVAQAQLDALSRAQSSLGALESAVQRPLQAGETAPSPPMFSKSPRPTGGQQW